MCCYFFISLFCCRQKYFCGIYFLYVIIIMLIPKSMNKKRCPWLCCCMVGVLCSWTCPWLYLSVLDVFNKKSLFKYCLDRIFGIDNQPTTNKTQNISKFNIGELDLNMNKLSIIVVSMWMLNKTTNSIC